MRKWKWPVPDPTPVSSIFELWESAADDGEQTEIFISSLLPADSIIERRPQCAWLHAVGEGLKKKKASAGVQLRPRRLTGEHKDPQTGSQIEVPALTRSAASVTETHFIPEQPSDSEIYFYNMFHWSLSDGMTEIPTIINLIEKGAEMCWDLLFWRISGL